MLKILAHAIIAGILCTAGADPLHLVSPTVGVDGETITVQYDLNGNDLIAHFVVVTKELSPDKKEVADLYDGNVVELFVSTTTRPGVLPRPYYEFEVSPYGQSFQAYIDVSGHDNENFRTPNLTYSASVGPLGWTADLHIPIKDLGWDGDVSSLSGNSFAIIGPTGARRFYSLNLPPQPKPDFHKPEFFRPFNF